MYVNSYQRKEKSKRERRKEERREGRLGERSDVVVDDSLGGSRSLFVAVTGQYHWAQVGCSWCTRLLGLWLSGVTCS